MICRLYHVSLARSPARPDRPVPPARPRPPPRGTRRRAAASARPSAAACGTPRGSRRPRASDASRSACRADGRRATPRTRTPPPPPRRASSMLGAPKCATSCFASVSTAASAVVVAGLDDLHQRRPAERGDAEKARAERRARLALSVAGSSSQNMKAPDTAHSPGSAARSNTNVSDGSSRMVRSSFMRIAAPGLRIEPGRLAPAPRSSGRRSTSGLARCAAPADRRCRRCRGARPFPASSRGR